MTDQMLASARRFIYTHARLLDRKRYEFWFEGGAKSEVLSALRAYQNADGGFGNALEPDIRCPQSQPVPTEMALQLLDELQEADPSIMEGILRYLRNSVLPGGGWPLIGTNAQQYPHAPWWAAEHDDKPSINPTGTIIGLLYKLGAHLQVEQEAWFRKAAEFVWRSMEEDLPSGYHDAVQWIPFLQHVPDRERAARQLDRLTEWLAKPGVIERDPKAEGYVHKVLDWAPSRNAFATAVVDASEIQTHLEWLVREQQEDGGWPISFPAVSSAGENEWRGALTVERLRTLRDYGKLQPN